MNKIMLLLALGSLLSSMYFFFVVRDLFAGSITLLMSLIFNLIFAMLNNTNKTGEKNK